MRNLSVALIVLSTLGVVATLATLGVGTIQEDSLLWNCYLMGNRQCGDVSHVAGFILGRD
jgi:hypothetical protein